MPYGYQLTDTGMVNKRGRPVHDLAIDPIQADWIRGIFSLTVREGYGSFRCAEYLNDKSIRTHSCTKFQCNTIIRILKNRIYIYTVSPYKMVWDNSQCYLICGRKNDEGRVTRPAVSFGESFIMA